MKRRRFLQSIFAAIFVPSAIAAKSSERVDSNEFVRVGIDRSVGRDYTVIHGLTASEVIARNEEFNRRLGNALVNNDA